MKNWKLSALLNTPPGTASRSTTVSRVYLIVALFVALIFGLVWLFQFQVEAAVAMRVYAGGEGLWSKAQKDAELSIEHYAISHDEADYQAYRRLIQVPLGDQRARIELQKPNPDLDIARKGFLQGRNHPVDIEYAIHFFRRFQHNGHMSRVIGHWTAADRLIAEINGVAGALHEEIASGRNNSEAIRSYHTRLDDINRRVTVEEDLFSSTLAEASRWANDAYRNLAYAIALLFVALGIVLSRPIITRIRVTENILFESEERYRRVIEMARDAIITLAGESGAITACNPAAEAMFGYSEEEAIGRVLHDFLAPPRFREAAMKGMAHFATTGEGAVIGKTQELAALRKNGTEFPIELSLSAMQIRSKWHATGIIRDITERKQAEEKLGEIQEKIQKIFDSSPDAISLLDLNGIVAECNQTAVNMLGYSSKEELLGASAFNFVVESERQRAMELLGELVYRGTMHNVELTMLRRDGSQFMGETAGSVLRDSSGKPTGLVVITTDITERKRMEQELRESEARYRRITEGITDYQYTVRIENGRAVETAQDPACVTVTGYTEEEFAANPYLWIQMVAPEDRERVMKHVNQIMAGNDGPPIEHRITRKNGETRWISDTTILFRDASGKLLSYDGVIKDITERKQAEKKSLEADIRLKEALTDAIGAIAATLEQRDPYTAGHQRRVAELASAIGEEMGLAPEVVEGIHFGGLIHDIGKISVPAEILNKPGRLTDTELGLIKTHAEAGYQIMKGIAFPWPVADMVRQHHERLDGSGYPQGLKGEQIVLEARILAVADVVEAMVSNRPYRPGLGIGAALGEITQGRGTRFDSVAVDACLRLIKEKGFIFTK